MSNTILKKRKPIIKDLDEFYKNLSMFSLIVGELVYFYIVAITTDLKAQGKVDEILGINIGFWACSGIYILILAVGYVKNAFETLERVGEYRRLILKVSEKKGVLKEYEGLGIKGEEREIKFSAVELRKRITPQLRLEFEKIRNKLFPGRKDIDLDKIIASVGLTQAGGKYQIHVIKSMGRTDIDWTKYHLLDIAIEVECFVNEDIYAILKEEKLGMRAEFLLATEEKIKEVELKILSKTGIKEDLEKTRTRIKAGYPYFYKEEIWFMASFGMRELQDLHDAVKTRGFEEEFDKRFLGKREGLAKAFAGKVKDINFKDAYKSMVEAIVEDERNMYIQVSREVFFDIQDITKRLVKASYPEDHVYEIDLDGNISVNTKKIKKDIWTGESKEFEEKRMIDKLDVILPAEFPKCFHFSDKRINFRGKWIKAPSVAEAEFKFLEMTTYDTGLFYCITCDWHRDVLEDVKTKLAEIEAAAENILHIKNEILIKLLDDTTSEQDIFKKIISIKDSIITKKDKEKEAGIQAVLDTFNPEQLVKKKMDPHIKSYNIGHFLLNLGVFFLAFIITYFINYLIFQNNPEGLGSLSGGIGGIVVTIGRDAMTSSRGTFNIKKVISNKIMESTIGMKSRTIEGKKEFC